MNCGSGKKWRYNDGGYLGEDDELSALMSIASNQNPMAQGQMPQGQMQPQKPKFDLQQFLQALGVGATAGLGGGKGAAIAPFLALLMNGGLSGLLGKGARTPGFNPNARMPFVDDGSQGG